MENVLLKFSYLKYVAVKMGRFCCRAAVKHDSYYNTFRYEKHHVINLYLCDVILQNPVVKPVDCKWFLFRGEAKDIN